jgi:hypothetical protein
VEIPAMMADNTTWEELFGNEDFTELKAHMQRHGVYSAEIKECLEGLFRAAKNACDNIDSAWAEVEKLEARIAARDEALDRIIAQLKPAAAALRRPRCHKQVTKAEGRRAVE